MAKNRIINTSFWSDAFVQELNPTDKLVFLYLLTNEHTDICGIYEISIKTMIFETDLSKDSLLKSIDRLRKANKINMVDGWVYVKNFSKHQQNNPKVQRGIEIGKSKVPLDIMNRLCINYDRGPHSNSNSNSNSNITKVIAVDTAIPQYGNQNINKILEAIKAKVGVEDFRESKLQQRIWGKNLYTLMEKITPAEFSRRLDVIKNDDFKSKNCGSLQYLYKEIKSFIEPKSARDSKIIF